MPQRKPQQPQTFSPRDSMVLDFSTPVAATQAIVEFAKAHPIATIVGVDDDTTLLATIASEALGLPHNPVESAKATRNKYRLRHTLATRGVSCPKFSRFSICDDIAEIRNRVDFPCVIKPLSLSAEPRCNPGQTIPTSLLKPFSRLRPSSVR